MRDRYGRSRFAQSVLLARRLVEAGVSLVQVNWTRIADQPNQGGWDTHAQAQRRAQGLPHADDGPGLLGPARRPGRARACSTRRSSSGSASSAARRGSTATAGRDHWGHVLLAGAGRRRHARRRRCYGASDTHGGVPASMAGSSRATCSRRSSTASGYDPDTEIHDSLGRPHPISRGRPIEAVL